MPPGRTDRYPCPMQAEPPVVPPLRERMPGYLTTFGLGLAGAAAVGLLVWLATSARLVDAVGYSFSGLGAVLLLVGGIKGSGYSGSARGGAALPNGERSARRGTSSRLAEVTEAARLDPVERRRRRLMAPPNPAAFWQVAAGCAYIGIGVLMTVLLAPR